MADTRDHDQASSPLRAGPYGRQSHGKATSVEDQDRANLAACEENGWTVAGRYSDLVSASRFGTRKRGDWDQLVEDVVAGKLDVVVIWDTSRGDRTLESWAAFISRCRERGVLIHATSHQRTYDPRIPRDWRVLMDDGVEAAFESEKKSVDVRRGVAGAAMAGKSHGRSSYGFTRVYDAADRKSYREVPNDKIAVAVEIIERVAREDPLRTIYTDLNERGIPSPEGRLWTSRTVKKIALNPAYIGKRRHLDALYPAAWDAVVSEEVFNSAGAVLSAPDRRSSPPGATKYLLSYLAVPPCKDGILTVQPTRGVCVECGERGCPDEPPCAECGGDEWRDLRPARYRCHTDACISIDRVTLDAYVTELALRRLAMDDAREAFAPDDEAAGRARRKVAMVKKELDDLAEQLDKGPDNGGISATLAAQAEPGIRRRLAEAQAERGRHTKHVALMELLDADDIRAAWEGMSVAARRSVLKVLFKLIEVGPSDCRLSRWATDAERLQAAADRTKIDWV